MNPDKITTIEEALEFMEELLELLHEIHYQLDTQEDLSDTDFLGSLVKSIERTLIRFGSMEELDE